MASRQQAEQKMKELVGSGPRDTKLTTHDFHGQTVKVKHDDGTFMFFESAFALRWKDWYFVFTEHNGYHLFNKEECQVIQYQSKNIEHAEEFEISEFSAEYWERKENYDKA